MELGKTLLYEIHISQLIFFLSLILQSILGWEAKSSFKTRKSINSTTVVYFFITTKYNTRWRAIPRQKSVLWNCEYCQETWLSAVGWNYFLCMFHFYFFSLFTLYISIYIFHLYGKRSLTYQSMEIFLSKTDLWNSMISSHTLHIYQYSHSLKTLEYPLSSKIFAKVGTITLYLFSLKYFV